MKKLNVKRILWPTDFSKRAEQAGHCANSLRVMFHAKLHVVHVCPPPLAPHIEALLPLDACSSLTDAKILEATRSNLEELASKLFGGGDSVLCDALVGNPWSEICAYAERSSIDLIVVATHGVSGLRHVLIGSTAERIVQHARCPVLAMKSFE